MAYVKHEFHCTECQKFFDIKLNMALDGNYRIHCPSCNHIHFRKVKAGKITDDRFDKDPDSVLIEDICPMKSSCRDIQKETVKTTGLGNFMRELWVDHFSGQLE